MKIMKKITLKPNDVFDSIKDTEVLSDEIMNEIEGATCDKCTHSCSKKHSIEGDDNYVN